MSAPQWRRSLIGIWLAVMSLTVVAVDGVAARGWMMFLVFGFVPPTMLLWLWKEDRPLLVGSLAGGRTSLERDRTKLPWQLERHRNRHE